MIIKYCPECIGFPYTKNMSMDTCPTCGSDLETEIVSKESFLKKREKLGEYKDIYDLSDNTSTVDTDDYQFGDGMESNQNYNDDSDLPTLIETSDLAIHKANRVEGVNNGNIIRGRVINYKCSSDEGGQYKRFFIQKLIDFFLYGQKMNDVLHRFCVHVGQSDELGYTYSKDIPVNVYGSVSSGLSLSDNCEVEVKGRYNNNHVFMARDVQVTNYGSGTKINFKHDPKAVADFVFMLIAMVLMVITMVNYDGSFFEGFGIFFKTWMIMLIIFGLLYLFLFAKLLFLSIIMGKGKFSISGVVFLSFIATLIYMNKHIIWASTGPAIMSFLQSIIVTIVFAAIIIYLLKALIGI